MKIEEKFKNKYLYKNNLNFFKIFYFFYQYIKSIKNLKKSYSNWGVDMMDIMDVDHFVDVVLIVVILVLLGVEVIKNFTGVVIEVEMIDFMIVVDQIWEMVSAQTKYLI